MPDADAPLIHAITPDTDVEGMLRGFTHPERARTQPGLHVVVHVVESGNVAYARLFNPASPGNGSERWLRHALRGPSPGGWSEAAHPRSQQELHAWQARNAEPLDRLLIDASKQAWRLTGRAPYIVEFPVVAYAETDAGAVSTEAGSQV